MKNSKRLILCAALTAMTLFAVGCGDNGNGAGNGTNNGTEATLQSSKNQFVNLTTSNTINYSNVFGGYHSLRVLAGQEATSYKYEYSYVSAPNVDPAMPYPNTAPQSGVESSVSFSNETMLSFFGIADYNYDNRYFVQATVREDGSSLFGSKNKWGLFWSASASWNISNERWMENSKNWLSLLKIRASYGLNGNNFRFIFVRKQLIFFRKFIVWFIFELRQLFQFYEFIKFFKD